jgi:hypothetical protein
VTDLTNIQQQFCRDNHAQMWDFIKNLEMTGHQVRWMVDTDERICGVFFIHQHGIEETRKLPECIVVDATYKTNSHKMVLLNFVIAGTLRSREKPKQLTTIPVAGCWLDRETSARYQWALGCFRDVVWPQGYDSKYELPNCFVTDNDEALLGAIKFVFPNSKRILCWIHIQRNFILKLKSNLLSQIRKNSKWFLYNSYVFFSLSQN